MDALKTWCFAQLCDVQYPSCLCESCSDPRHQADPADQSSMGQADAEGLQLQLLVGFARALESRIRFGRDVPGRVLSNSIPPQVQSLRVYAFL